MPTYELALLLKPLPKVDMAAILKRTAVAIWDHGGVVRKMENFGVKPMPYKISAHDNKHSKAHYFVFNVDLSKDVRASLVDNYKLDIDIIRCRLYHRCGLQMKVEEPKPCDLYLDLLPPPYRPSVQKMVEQAKRREKPKFKYNSGMDYYPFQR